MHLTNPLLSFFRLIHRYTVPEISASEKSMSELIIYHNPRCSKSRQTLAILNDEGITPTIVEYLNTPPDAETLQSILNMLQRSPRELMRTKEDVYTENNLADPALSEADLIQAMIDHPILIERPIVVRDGRAIIGRPPENVRALI